MQKISKVLSIFLVVLMVLTAAPLSGFVGLKIELPEWPTFEAKAAGEYFTSGYCGEITEATDGTQISWVLDENGVLTITGEGRMASEAFNYDLRIKKAVIGVGITNISSYAFANCKNLVDIEFPTTVTEIGERAFYNCDSITDVSFNQELELIDDYAFYNCDNLNIVNFNENLKEVSGYAFYNCDGITELNFTTGPELIDGMAFTDCDSITELNFKKGTKRIGYNAFGSCDALTKIDFNEGLEDICMAAFSECKNITELTFKEGLKIIDVGAFANCKSITEIILPESLETISEKAFINCSNLSGEIIISDNVKIFEDNVFSGTKITSVYIGSGVTEMSSDTFSGCGSLSNIEVSENNSNYSSHSGALYNKAKTKMIVAPAAISGTVIIPESVTEFSYTAIDKCKNITNLNIEENNALYKSVDGIVYTADGKKLIVCPRGKIGAIATAEGTTNIDKYFQ